jgi:hypothetical protein
VKKRDVEITHSSIYLGMRALSNNETNPTLGTLTVIVDNMISRYVIGTHIPGHWRHYDTIFQREVSCFEGLEENIS